MTLQIKRVRAEAVLPERATQGSAGLDLRACTNDETCIMPGDTALLPTGLAVALPEGSVGLVFGRSGLGIRHGIVPANAVGVIDADYRGEILVGLTNHSAEPYIIVPGDRIAQLVIVPVLTPPIEEVINLSDTARGEGGFGSTGKE
ncbi:MAG: deoxyuridine 5-triphosphate nucleotidohydrolase [Oscillospiraceae bacterium]|jgi:dUTP pyrophosphatase|nr:deoxyuridine 5-triphosphate nucleotidohydrolase [Oscillospiraceae bacterium]